MLVEENDSHRLIVIINENNKNNRKVYIAALYKVKRQGLTSSKFVREDKKIKSD